MIDIAALIEQLRNILTGAIYALPETNVRIIPYEIVEQTIAALTRLTAPALPEDIAWLIDVLNFRAHERAGNNSMVEAEQLMEWLAASALQAQAAEIERLNAGWHEANVDALKKSLRIAELEAEIERLNERLENNHVYERDESGDLKRIEVPPGSVPDGIECRNETIKLQDANIDRLRKRIAELEAERDHAKADASQLRRALVDALTEREAEIERLKSGIDTQLRERENVEQRARIADLEQENERLKALADRDAAGEMIVSLQRSNAELEAERDEALQLTESCSTLKEMASACIEGATMKAERDELFKAGEFHQERGNRLQAEIETLKDAVSNSRQCARDLLAECEKIKAERDDWVRRYNSVAITVGGERDAIRRQTIKECGDTVHADGVCQAHTEEAHVIALKIEEAVRALATPKENEQQASV